jgi:hypothetical protein
VIEWLKIQLGLAEPETLVQDTLFCGSNGGKYSEKYFFVLATDESVLILDRAKLKVMDTYLYAIQSINYLGMDFRQFNKEKDVLDNSNDLVKTMEGLKQ